MVEPEPVLVEPVPEPEPVVFEVEPEPAPEVIPVPKPKPAPPPKPAPEPVTVKHESALDDVCTYCGHTPRTWLATGGGIDCKACQETIDLVQRG